MENISSVSVLFAVSNEIDHIESSIESILRQDYPEELIEIIFIDGLSSDGTYEILEKYKKRRKNIKLIRNQKIISAAGWNIGIRNAISKYILIMSGHAEISVNYIKECVHILETSDYAAVGGKTTPVGTNKFSDILAKTMQTKFGVGNATYFLSNKNKIAETIVFGCYRRDILIEIGGFDEAIFRGQDWDLNYRIRARGYNLFQLANISSKYYVRSSLKKVWKRHLAAGKWKIYIIRNHPKSLMLRHVIPFIFVVSLLSFFIIGFFNKIFIFILLSEIGLYFSMGMVSLVKNKVNKVLQIITGLAIYFVMHFSYGMGMLFQCFQYFCNFKSKK